MFTAVERYIVVKTSNAIFVFNLESMEAIDSFYKAFMDLLQQMQTDAVP